MSHPAYEKMKTSATLPTPAGVALEISRLADSEHSTIAEMSKLVERDPAIASRLLKMVNSPSCGIARRVASVSAAVSLIGLRTVKMTALGFSVLSNNRTGKCAGFDYDVYWSRCLGRAATLQQLTQSMRSFASDEVFTCGLLSKIGQLALATAYPKEYSELLARVKGLEGAGICAAEEKQFGIDHNVLSGEMMADWRLPKVFQDATRAQDAPGSLVDAAMNAEELAKLLGISNRIANALLSNGPSLNEELRKLLAPTGVPDHNAQTTLNYICQEWRDLATGLKMPVPAAPETVAAV